MTELRIDAETLIMALENHSYEIEYFLDRQTGEVFPVFDGDDVSDEDRERIDAYPERFEAIDPRPSSVAFEVMESFVETLSAGSARSDLERALRGRRPFRSFKDALLAWPRVREAWFEFHDREWLRLAREWLDEQQIAATVVERGERAVADELDCG